MNSPANRDRSARVCHLAVSILLFCVKLCTGQFPASFLCVPNKTHPVFQARHACVPNRTIPAFHAGHSLFHARHSLLSTQDILRVPGKAFLVFQARHSWCSTRDISCVPSKTSPVLRSRKMHLSLVDEFGPSSQDLCEL